MESSRRNFLISTTHAIATYVFLFHVTQARAWTQSVESKITKWAKRLGEIGHDVQSGEITPIQWQSEMDRLYQNLSVSDLSQFINKDQILKTLHYPKEKIGAIGNISWPKVQGFPKDLIFGHKLFVYRKGTVTPPHAHNHLVSAHFVIEGEIQVRTFNREMDLENSLLISPSQNRIAKIGELITMSDTNENVHWFEGIGERSISFDIPIANISPKKTYRQIAGDYNQIFIDPTVPARSDGKIEAPILSFQESLKKFVT